MHPVRLLKFVAAFGWGGTERQFVNLGVGLDPSRFAVHFGCLRRFGMMLDELERFGIPVLDYGVFHLRDVRALAAQLRLARDIRRHGIDVVHTYGFHANLFAIPAARLAGAPVVASIRDLGVYLTPSQRVIQRWVCRLADRVLVNAEAIREWLVEEGYARRRITVIPNGIDISRFAQPSRRGRLHSQLALPLHVQLVAAIGRVSRLKGLEDFIAAAALVSRRFPSARFLIIGEPSFMAEGSNIIVDHSYEDELRQLAARLGLRDRVIFTGFRGDIERILPDLAVSVLPSLSEGLSNTLLESMAAGVPVVATRVGGSVEVVQDGDNGLLAPPGSPRDLAGAICRFLEDPAFARRAGEAARQRIAEHYSMRRLVERTSRFYESLLNREPAAQTRKVVVPTPNL